MAHYAIGDIQGCMSSLQRLLDVIGFSPSRDAVWLVGDLVNRGPRSLDVLRWAMQHDGAVTAVLGNHDVHLLARAAGIAGPKKRDTLDDVLAAPDRGVLIDWLRARRIVHVADPFVMMHAGLHPRWSVATARALASEIETAMRGTSWRVDLAELVGKRSKHVEWRDDLTGTARLRTALTYFISVRMCSNDGTMEVEFNGAPADAPPDLTPWFALPNRQWTTHVPVFGHWAALGLEVAADHIALDSGCVWGRQLSAIRLPERAVTQVDTVEQGLSIDH